jgi:DNA primase
MSRDRLMFLRHTVGKISLRRQSFKAPETEKQGKYLNSPSSPIYTKEHELFGLN